MMSNLVKAATAATILAFAAALAPAEAQKSDGTCVKKAASGTNISEEGARFQAWEAVLQATDWGSWASFMGSGAKIGTAPGYKASGVSWKCQPGGIGYSCKMQATLCK